jgi:hypothetical protein
MFPRLQTHSRCGRALASPRTLWHWSRHLTEKGSGVAMCPAALDPLPVPEGSVVTTCGWVHRLAGKGSGVATCPAAPNPPLSTRGLWRCHVRSGLPSSRKGLRCRHVARGSRPTSWCRRALASSRAPWLSAPEVCPCVPKTSDIRLIMGSPSDSHTRRMASIKYIQYIDMTGRRQYGTDLLVTRNGQATV